MKLIKLNPIIISLTIFCVCSNGINSQSKLRQSLSYNIGFNYFLLEEVTKYGGGLGCWGGNRITSKNANYAFNLGVGMSLITYQDFTLSTAVDLMYINSSNQVEGGFSCLFGKVSDSKGELKFNTFAFKLPIILTLKIPDSRFSIDAGIYAFLPFSSAKYDYIYTLYVDNMKYMQLPEPLITNELKKRNSLNSLGLTFGLGYSFSKDIGRSLIKLSYQSALQPSLELSYQESVKFNGIELKMVSAFN